MPDTIQRKIQIGHGTWLEIDTEDPATPAMVYCYGGSATYDLAIAEGTVEDFELRPQDLKSLERFQGLVDRAYAIARDGNPDYD